MKTLSLKNGDLVLRGGNFVTIGGSAKVEQDLAIWSLFPYGSTRFHPRFGAVFSNYIGQPTNATTQSMLRAEVVRIINNYQQVQISRINSTLLAGKKPPYKQTTLIKTVTSITVTQSYDSFKILIRLVLVSGTLVTLTHTVSSNPSVTAS